MTGEKQASTPNFFLLLGLNPNDSWDDKKFEQVLETKRSEWARKSNTVGKTAMEAKRNLALYPEIKRIMSNPEERSLLVADAQKEQNALRQEKLEEFNRQVEITIGKGFLEQAELDKLIADFKDVSSEREIKERLKKVPIKASSQNAGAQQLDPTTLKAINDGLRFLAKNDLYDFLGMPETTSNEALSKTAQELYEDMQRRQPKTPEVTTTSALSGHARVIFKTNETRQKYNESRRQSQLTALLEEFEKTINRGKQKGLYSGQVTLFLNRAARDGWSQEEARSRLQEHAHKRNWFLEMPTLEIESDNQRCGYCKAINPRDHKVCTECGADLLIICPDCGLRVPPDSVGCGKCGFPVGNRHEVDSLLADCRDLLTRQHVEEAEKKLSDADVLWSPKKADKRRENIQKLKDEIQNLSQARRESKKQLDDLLNQHKFFAARTLLGRLQANILSDKESYTQRANQAISQAQSLLKQAETSSRIDTKIDLTLQALRICTDFQEAHDFLSNHPPIAPSDLQYQENGSTISLRWNASPTRNVSYRVVRKVGSQPVSLNDGQVLGTVTGCIYEDTQPEIGAPTFYTVFATLIDIPSRDAARLSRPVFLLRDVVDIKQRVDNHRVELSWKAHPRVAGILIVRKEGTSPRSSNDGANLVPLDFNHILDTTVENDRCYYYAIYSQFKDYSGKLVSSPGVTVSVQPEAAPEPISALEVESSKVAQGYEVKLHWPTPKKGQVVILKSNKIPSLKAGETISRSELARHGTILEGHANTCIDRRSQSGVEYYMPIVLFHEIAYIGQAKRVTLIDDISDLRYQNLGFAIRLNWSWPANCQEAYITYSQQGWPQSENATQSLQKVTRAEYEQRGYYDIKGTSNSDYYIVVAAAIVQGNDRIIGSGTRIHARLESKIVITYEIKMARSGFFSPKKRMLLITARGQGSLPTLLIVSKQGRLPLRKEEGDLFYRLSGPISIENNLEKELPEKTFASRTFGKLYLEDDQMYEMVTIHHPGEEKLRLA